MPPRQWNSQVIEGDAVDGLRRLKDEIDGDLFLSGCGELACGLLEGGVVDEVNLFIHPSIGGTGARPFEGTTLNLELLDVTGYDSGVVLQRYGPRPDAHAAMTHPECLGRGRTAAVPVNWCT